MPRKPIKEREKENLRKQKGLTEKEEEYVREYVRLIHQAKATGMEEASSLNNHYINVINIMVKKGYIENWSFTQKLLILLLDLEYFVYDQLIFWDKLIPAKYKKWAIMRLLFLFLVKLFFYS